MYLDIKKAHVIPLCEQDVYVELPREAEAEDDECGKLIHWLYGCRPAAQDWEEHYLALLKNHGFKRLKSVPVAFVHETRDMSGVVISCGKALTRTWIGCRKCWKTSTRLKNRGRLGFGPNDVRKIDMLGRVIELTHAGITWQGDPRHFDLLQEYFCMDDKTKVLTKNGYEDGPNQVELRETGMSMEECKAFWMIAARFNYMAQDNPWLQFHAKEVCRNMAKPRASDFMKIKRLVRFLKGAGGIKFLYAWQNEDEACDITVLVDSDWAGNTETRKSTSGGALKVGKHVIRTWSSTQTTVATSSGEAELIAMYDGATRELGMQTVMIEMSLSPQLKMVRISIYSSIAKSFVATRGLGKMRHLEVKFLWLQETVQMGKVRVEKVSGATTLRTL